MRLSINSSGKSPEDAWFELASQEGKSRGVMIEKFRGSGNECLKFGVKEGSDSEYQAVGKIHCSLSENRTCNAIWNEFTEEIEANKKGEPKVFSLILDINNSDQRGFEWGTDYFLAVPADVLQKEVNSDFELAIKIKGDGRYEYPFNNYVDDWEVLFS